MAFEDDLTAATQALNDAAAAYHGKITEIDGRVDQAEGEYAALAADLRAVINEEMYFQAVIDPDDPAPTNVRGGTFNTVRAAILAAPVGSLVEMLLVAGKIHVLDADVIFYKKYAFFGRVGAGADPILRPLAYSTGAENRVYQFKPDGSSLVKFRQINIELPSAKADGGLGWVINPAMINVEAGVSTRVALISCAVSGAESIALMSARYGHYDLGLNTVTLDGAISAITGAALGVGRVVRYAVTLTNGAALDDGATPGTNQLLV